MSLVLSVRQRLGMLLCAAAAALAVADMRPAAASDAPVLLELLRPGEGNPLRLTRADLEALPQTGFETTTIWSDGRVRFSGPRLADVVALAGLAGQAVRATAENEYSVRIPAEAIGPEAPIVALRIDDRPFERRELGPLWIVFPYDSDPAYQSEAVYSMSIWQLIRIEREPG